MRKESEIEVVDKLYDKLDDLFNFERVSRVDSAYNDSALRLKNVRDTLKNKRDNLLLDEDYKDIIWYLIMLAIENRDIESARKEAITFSEYFIDYDKGNITREKLISVIEGGSN